MNDPGRRGFFGLPAWLLVTLLLIVQTAISAAWMHTNGFLERPPTIEQAYYRARALDLLLVLQHDGVLAWAKACFTQAEFRTFLFPAAVSLVAAGSAHGVQPIHMWITIAAFSTVFTIASYRLARNFGSPRFAWCVAAVTLCCPVVVAYQRPFYPQFPMKAFALLALDFLVRSRGFSCRRSSVGFAAATAIATMCKVIAPLYLAGAALAAAAFGLVDPARRRATLKNLGVATLVVVVLLAPWQAVAYPKLMTYTKSATDDSIALRQMADKTSFTRWTYYPRHLYENGFGAPLALLIAGAGVVTLTRLRKRARDPRRREAGLVLAASAALCFPVLTYGQTAAQSQYVLIYVPLGVLLLALTIADSARLVPRRVASIATAAAALFGLALVLRPPSRDVAGFALGPLPVVVRVDWFITDLPRQRFMIESSTPESWPITAVTRAMLEHSPSRPPRVATTHMYLCGPNLEHEAKLLGRSIEEVVPDWAAALRPGGDLSFLTRVDFLVIDSQDFAVDAAVAALARVGIGSREILRVQTAPHVTITLLALEPT